MSSNDPASPNFVPIWMRESPSPTGDAAPAHVDPPAPERQDRKMREAALVLTDQRIITLEDGRKCKLIKSMEVTVDGRLHGTQEKRYQYFWQGPKQLKIIVGDELTPMGMLATVIFGYPNHEPTLNDIRQIRMGFFPDNVDVMWAGIPTPLMAKADSQLRFMVLLTAMPQLWSAHRIHLPT